MNAGNSYRFLPNSIKMLIEQHLAVFGTMLASPTRVKVGEDLRTITLYSCPLLFANASYLVGLPFDIEIIAEEPLRKTDEGVVRFRVNKPVTTDPFIERIFNRLMRHNHFFADSSGMNIRLRTPLLADSHIDVVYAFKEFLKTVGRIFLDR